MIPNCVNHSFTQYTKLTFPLKVNVYPQFYRDGTIRKTQYNVGQCCSNCRGWGYRCSIRSTLRGAKIKKRLRFTSQSVSYSVSLSVSCSRGPPAAPPRSTSVNAIRNKYETQTHFQTLLRNRRNMLASIRNSRSQYAAPRAQAPPLSALGSPQRRPHPLTLT